MFLGLRIGSLLVAGGLLYIALRLHKSSRRSNITKPAGVALSFLAGLALLGTVVGSWMGAAAGWFGVAGVVAMLIASAIIVIDVFLDKRPDKPAFWAALVLPTLIVFGVSQWPNVVNQIESGADRVGQQVARIG